MQGEERYLETKPALRKGVVVLFETPPHTVGNELSGRHYGVVASHTGFNEGNTHSILVIPILRDDSADNKALGIPSGVERFDGHLRPDLARYVGKHLCCPVRLKGAAPGDRIIVPQATIELANQRLIDIVSPTPRKLNERNPRGLSYGEIRWFECFARSQMPDVEDKVPAVCLSTREQQEQTGIALLGRVYTNLERYNPRQAVVIAPRQFRICFFSTSDIQALSVKRIESRSLEREHVGHRAMKGCAKKLAGILEEKGYQKIKERYTDEIGRLPEYIRREIDRRNRTQHYRTQHFAPR